jgi:hypothetical protein
MQLLKWLLSPAALMLAIATPAAAQPGTGKVVASINVGVQAAPTSLSDSFSFERNVETATVNVKYPMKAAALLDGGVGVRLWRHVGAGIAVSHTSRNGSAMIDASIPHPFVFDQPRVVSGEQSDITHAETAVHIQVLYSIPVKRTLTLLLSAGPSRLSVEQELVTDIKYDETYPYDVATFAGALTHRAKASVTGFNAGADLRWMFTKSIGLGGLVRFTRGTVDLETQDNRRLPLRAGGVHAGGGLRIVF